MLGIDSRPSRRIIAGEPFAREATTEYVVPRSIPILATAWPSFRPISAMDPILVGLAPARNGFVPHTCRKFHVKEGGTPCHLPAKEPCQRADNLTQGAASEKPSSDRFGVV